MQTNKELLTPYHTLPVKYGTLEADLEAYASPKDKIDTLVKDGFLVRLKKGLYVVADTFTGQPYSKNLIANHMYGPSYVSLETALSYYGIIPESVRMVRSVTTKRSNFFQNVVGRFEYSKASPEYYSIGITTIEDSSGYSYLIATPEKAICDTLYFARGHRIQSKRALREFLFEDMRVDLSLFLDYFDGVSVSETSAEDTASGSSALFEASILEDVIALGKKTALFTLLLEVMQDELGF